MNILDNKKYKDKNVYVYITTLKYTERTGTININKYKFDNLIRLLLRKYGKYTKSSEIYYEYYDKRYVVINGYTRKVLKKENIKVLCKDNLIVNILNEKTIDHSLFPIITKYHNIMKKNKMNYESHNCIISLVTESYPENPTNYYVELSFRNSKCNYSEVDGIINFLKSNLK